MRHLTCTKRTYSVVVREAVSAATGHAQCLHKKNGMKAMWRGQIPWKSAPAPPCMHPDLTTTAATATATAAAATSTMGQRALPHLHGDIWLLCSAHHRLACLLLRRLLRQRGQGLEPDRVHLEPDGHLLLKVQLLPLQPPDPRLRGRGSPSEAEDAAARLVSRVTYGGPVAAAGMLPGLARH